MLKVAWLAALLTVASAVSALAQAPRHPLDPLTWEEHWVALEVVRDARQLTAATRFGRIALKPPEKTAVWQWQAGQPMRRTALAIVKQGARTFEAEIDLAQRRLIAWRERPGVQLSWLDEEVTEAGELVKADTAWQRAMRRRGYTDFSFIDCGGGAPGNLGQPEFQGRRVAIVGCTDVRRYRNLWGRGIPGVYGVVDLGAKRVLRIEDDGTVVPVPAGHDYDPATIPPRAPAPPLVVSQPNGPGFRVEGHQLTWQQWSLHVRADPRVATVVSTVRWHDGERTRPVLYEGHLSEIFVPYMDPGFPWYMAQPIDAGEFSTLQGGMLAKPLEPGIDCPAHAAYLDQLGTGATGRPVVGSRALCIFERVPGDPAWRHLETTVAGRPRRDLVIRSAAVFGNYDYFFDWIFQQDGTIRVVVGATGIVATKPVAVAKAVAAGRGSGLGASPAGGERPDAYGRFVAPNLVAVNHDHYFNFRLDLDVGGPGNSLQVDRLKPLRLPKGHPRKSLWVLDPVIVRHESDGKLHQDMAHPALWRVINPSQSNRQGYPISYELKPGMGAQTLLSADDWPRRRAGFIDHHLWVTAYDPAERYAAGDYPLLSPPGEGLPKWTAANRRVENADLVLWYTVGFQHLARAEDWPVMPVAWHSFELRPFDFFDRNPTMDLPVRP